MLKSQLKKKIVMQENALDGFKSLVLEGGQIEAKITKEINKEGEELFKKSIEIKVK